MKPPVVSPRPGGSLWPRPPSPCTGCVRSRCPIPTPWRSPTLCGRSSLPKASCSCSPAWTGTRRTMRRPRGSSPTAGALVVGIDLRKTFAKVASAVRLRLFRVRHRGAEPADPALLRRRDLSQSDRRRSRQRRLDGHGNRGAVAAGDDRTCRRRRPNDRSAAQAGTVQRSSACPGRRRPGLDLRPAAG